MSSDLYHGMEPVAETFILTAERDREPAEGLIVRTATYFQFVDRATGRFVTPLYERSTSEYWKGIRMKCLVASLIGRSRNIIQAGYWGVDFPDLHFELMHIDGLTGMFLEKEQSWRRGKEDIIWVHTRKYAYALQAPVAPYAAVWNEVLADWQRGHLGRSGAFQEVDRTKPKPPSWWTGKQDWQALQEYEEPQGEDRDKDEDEDEDEDEGGGEVEEGEDKGGDKGSQDDSDYGNNGGPKSKSKGKGESTRDPAPKRSTRSSSSHQLQPAQGQVAPERSGKKPSLGKDKGKGKGKARATTPEDHAEESGSPPTSPVTGQRTRAASRKIKNQNAASQPGPSRVETSVVDLSGAGPSTISASRSKIKPSPRPAPGAETVPDEDSRPSKKPRIDPPPGGDKTKQMAGAAKVPVVDASTSPQDVPPPPPPQDAPPPPPQDVPPPPPPQDAPPPPQYMVLPPSQDVPPPPPPDAPNPTLSSEPGASSNPPPRVTLTVRQWQERRAAAALQHKEIRAENLQVPLSTPPGGVEPIDDGGNVGDEVETDMSVSSTGAEGATRQSLIKQPGNSQVPTRLPSELVSHAEAMLSESTAVLQRTRSSDGALSAIPTVAPTSSEQAARREQVESLAALSLQQAVEVVERITGRQVKLDLPIAAPGQANEELGSATTVSAEQLHAPAVAGPSMQPESQATPPRRQGPDDIGSIMTSLDLANCAPVRPRKKVAK